MKVKYCIFILMLSLSSRSFSQVLLQQRLNKYCEPLGYTFDSRIDTMKSDLKVYLKVQDNLSLSDSTRVADNGFLVVPVIVGGGYKFDYTVTMGKKSVTPTFAQFIYDSFKTEAQRSGTFQMTDKAFRSDYRVEMDLTGCNITADYHKDGVRFEHTYKRNFILKPVTGNFTVEVRLYKKNIEIFSKEYSSTLSVQTETLNLKSEEEMNSTLMVNFARTASIEIKEIIEASIRDINEQIK